MVASCCAYECTNRFGKLNVDGTKLKFHLFPFRKPVLLKKWILAVKRASWKPSKSSALCGDHFAETAYKSSARRYLKDDAIPSIFSLPSHLQKPKRECALPIRHPLPNSQNQGFAISSSLKNEARTSLMSLGNSTINSAAETEEWTNEKTPTEINIPSNTSSVLSHTSVKQLKSNETHIRVNSSFLRQTLENKNLPKIPAVQTFFNPNKRKKFKGTQTEFTSSDILNQKLELKQLRTALMKIEDNDSLRKKFKGTQTKLTSSDILNQKLELKQLREFYESNALLRNVSKMQALYNEGLASKQIEFTLNQISNFERKNPRWSDSVLRECVFLHATSPEGYEALRHRELLKLPGRRTLYRFLKPTTANNKDEFCDAIFELPATTDHDKHSDTNFEPTTATDHDELSDTNFEPTTATDQDELSD